MNDVLATILYIIMIILYIAASVAMPCFLIFLTLKVFGIIAWNWIFVLIPLLAMACCIALLGILDVVLKEREIKEMKEEL